jgi:hypothetical protein
VDATDRFGLTGVEGTRINAADLDGDGWTDLVVRRGGLRSDDFTTDTRHTWLLKNDEGNGFTDVTRESAFLKTRLSYETDLGRPGEVMAFADVDNDGDVDGFTGLETTDPSKALGERSEVMLNNGDGTFAFAPNASDLRAGGLSAPAGASFTDFDLDGVLDLWVPEHNTTDPATGVTHFLQDHLYRGAGDGTFTSVTADLGLTTNDWIDLADLNDGRAHSRAWGALACDLTGDGRAELLAPSYGRSPNHLWVAGDDGFTNASVSSGYAYDENLDWTDNEFARCHCQAHPGDGGCDQAGAPRVQCSANWRHETDREPFRLGGNSAQTTCADLDNDGDFDLLTSEIKHWWAGENADGSEVLLNDGAGELRFTRPGDAVLGLEVPKSGVAWDEGHMTNAVLDLDNDGWLDLYIGASDYDGNRGLLYRSNPDADGLLFEPVPVEQGVDHPRSHGVVVLDVDRDGDQDLVVGHSRARCGSDTVTPCFETMQVRVFENVIGDTGNWLQLDLEGTGGSNRDAIGALVTVTADGVTQSQQVLAGFGHYGAQSERVLHFGLGTACEAEVTVRWPDAAGTTETFTLPAGHRLKLVQGEAPSAS